MAARSFCLPASSVHWERTRWNTLVTANEQASIIAEAVWVFTKIKINPGARRLGFKEAERSFESGWI